MTKSTAYAPVADEQLPTVTLRLADWVGLPGRYAIREAWAYTTRLHYSQRIFLLVVLADLRSSGGEVHWHDVLRAYNSHVGRIHPRRAPMTRERFWDWVWPLVMAGAVQVRYSADWPVSA